MAQISRLTAKQIAAYFVWRAQKQQRPVTNKKLQKLLYYAQAWSVVLRKQKLFSDKIEAWVHGPAVRSVYLDYREFGFNPITSPVDSKELSEIPQPVRRFLDEVWKVYGKYDAAYLELLSHSEAPWQKAREGLAPDAGSTNEISLREMKSFFAEKLEQSKS